MALFMHLHPEEVWRMDPIDYATIVDELTDQHGKH